MKTLTKEEAQDAVRPPLSSQEINDIVSRVASVLWLGFGFGLIVGLLLAAVLYAAFGQ